MDTVHEWTKEQIKGLERKIKAEYRVAHKQVQAKAEAYMARFEKADAKKRDLVDAGKLSQDEYKSWAQGQVMVGKRWNDLATSLAKEYTNANTVAMNITSSTMNTVFAENANFAAYQISHDVDMNLSFILYDHDTVVRLLRNDPDLLPKPEVDIDRDVKWNKQKVNSAVLQGILQGDPIPQIAKRLTAVTDMATGAAIRNARTMTTSAQNAGRVQSYKRAEGMGIKLQKEWLTTLDGRTRHSHRMMDGVRVPVDSKFPNGCEYPADPSGPSWEIYNCRCTLVPVVDGINQSGADRFSRLGDTSYDEWKGTAQPYGRGRG